MFTPSLSPYPIAIYDKFTKLNETLQKYEFAQICILFKCDGNFSIFLKKIEPLILSYQVVKTLEWKACAKKIDALFPIKTPDEESHFTIFKERIQKRFYILDEPLVVYERMYSLFPKQQEAEILQIFLNALVVEADLGEKIMARSIKKSQAIEMKTIIQQVSVKKRIKGRDVQLFEIREDLLQEAKSIFKKNKYIKWNLIEKINYIYLDSLQHDLGKIKDELKKLIHISESNINFILENLIRITEQKKLEQDLLKSREEIVSFCKQGFIEKKFFVKSNDRNNNLVPRVTPFLIGMKAIFDLFNADVIIEKAAEQWSVQKINQQEFFNLLFNKFELTVQKMGEKGLKFCQDLTSQNKNCRMLRPYPLYDVEMTSHFMIRMEKIQSTLRVPITLDSPPVKTLPKKLSHGVKVIKAFAKPKPGRMDLQFAHKMVSVQYNKQVTPNPVPQEMRLIKAFPGQKFPYRKDGRLKIWENHPFQTPLLGDDFKDYSHLPLEEQVWQHIYHAPHPLVDRFIHLGVKGIWESEDRISYDCRRVLAEIEFKGEQRTGCFEFNIIFDRACYHRGFSTNLEGELLELHAQKMQEKNSTKQAKRPEYVDRYKTWVKTDTAGNVEIFDTEKNLLIKLFNAKIIGS